MGEATQKHRYCTDAVASSRAGYTRPLQPAELAPGPPADTPDNRAKRACCPPAPPMGARAACYASKPAAARPRDNPARARLQRHGLGQPTRHAPEAMGPSAVDLVWACVRASRSAAALLRPPRNPNKASHAPERKREPLPCLPFASASCAGGRQRPCWPCIGTSSWVLRLLTFQLNARQRDRAPSICLETNDVPTHYAHAQ